MEKSYENLSLFEFQQRFATDDLIWQQKNGKTVTFVPSAVIRITAQEVRSILDNVRVADTPIRQLRERFFTK